MTEFFQIAGMLIPATERLESSVRKARPCGNRRRRWSMESPSGPWTVEEPAFLMAAATPLSSNGLFEGSTRWWWLRFLMILLIVRSCWAEQAVNCLLKARAIAFGLEWVFPSKAIEIFGGGLILLPPNLRSRDQYRLGLVARSEDSSRDLSQSWAAPTLKCSERYRYTH